MGLSPNDRRPKQRQIADWIISQILDGTLAPGDRLPSARELMERFDVSNQTAQNAVKLLQAEGLAEGVPGRGTFLAEDLDLDNLTHRIDEPATDDYIALSAKLGELADEMRAVHRRLDEIEATQAGASKRSTPQS